MSELLVMAREVAFNTNGFREVYDMLSACRLSIHVTSFPVYRIGFKNLVSVDILMCVLGDHLRLNASAHTNFHASKDCT